MNGREATSQKKLSQWMPIIKECLASGMSARSWCQQNDVNEKQFYYWQRKIKIISGELLPVRTPNPKFIQVPVNTSKPEAEQSSSRFIPSMVIHIGKAVVELADHAQPELLTSVLKVLSDV